MCAAGLPQDYLPPDEVLRRLHSATDPPETLAQWAVTSAFAALSRASSGAQERLRWLPVLLGLEAASLQVFTACARAALL